MIGYKIAAYMDNDIWKPCLIKLEIPEDAKIVTPVTYNNNPLSIPTYSNKLRCNKCRVCSITDLEIGKSVNFGFSLYILGLIINDPAHYQIRKSITPIQMWLDKYAFHYTASSFDYIYPDSLDENIKEECANGIHFFYQEVEARHFYNDPDIYYEDSWARSVIRRSNELLRKGFNYDRLQNNDRL